MRSATLVKDPRRMRFRVISANQRSTRLSKEVEPRRGLTIYLAQEFEELLMAMAIETFSDNGSPQAR
jgi:hypothetical protein